MLLAAAILFLLGSDGFKFIMDVISITFIISGLNQIIFYFRLARHMIGGKAVLIKGLITLDIGALTVSMLDSTELLIISYILGCHLISGVIDVLKTNEARQLKSPHWKLDFTVGVGNILMAIICFICAIGVGSIILVIYLYAFVLVYSAINRIASAFRRTEIVYIQ